MWFTTSAALSSLIRSRDCPSTTRRAPRSGFSRTSARSLPSTVDATACLLSRVAAPARRSGFSWMPAALGLRADRYIRGLSSAVGRDPGGEYPWLQIHAVCADFNAGWSFLDALPDGKRVIFYPGSTIGNLEPAVAREFLRGSGRGHRRRRRRIGRGRHAQVQRPP
jgi:hypothetical protein